jgi:hypothetical protein
LSVDVVTLWALRLTWKVSLHCCGVEVVVLLESLAVDVVECVEANSAVCSYEREQGKEGVEELHRACW